MVTVHVPIWDIETAFEVDDDGEVGQPTHYFVREHCPSSFVWSLDQHLRWEEGKALLDPAAIEPIVLTDWWYKRYSRSEDGRIYWEYVPTGEHAPHAFRVTFVLAWDLDGHLFSICSECVHGRHDRCELQYHYSTVHMRDNFSKGRHQHRRWTGFAPIDFEAWRFKGES